MKKLTELQTLIDEVLSTKWQRRDGESIPEAENVKLGNDAVDLEATVLYADLVDSTGLVQSHKDWFAAEVYKTYLLVACEIIRNNNGVITAFDGDRVMAVFIGGSKNSNAAKSALQINHMVTQEINPRIRNHYKTTTYQVKQVVGIDTSKVLVARTGVRGSNDLVWVGRAANYAAKLCSLRTGSYASYITSDVYSKLSKETKMGGNPEQSMWEKVSTDQVGVEVYRSSWRWKPS